MKKTVMKKVAHIMLGLPGCGKSTQVDALVKETPGLHIICRDDIRCILGVNGHDSRSYNPSIEPTVSYIADNMLKAVVSRGMPVALDETHTHPANLEKQMDYFCRLGYEVHVWYFNVGVDVCVQSRPLIGLPVYEKMMRQLIESLEVLSHYKDMKLVEVHKIERR